MDWRADERRQRHGLLVARKQLLGRLLDVELSTALCSFSHHGPTPGTFISRRQAAQRATKTIPIVFVVSHGRYVAFQMAEVAIGRQMFQEILRHIAELRPQPPPALA